MTILFKYRDISTGDYWKRIFTHNEFWFSKRQYLDDEDEISLRFLVPEWLQDHYYHQIIQNNVSILSLGQCSNNLDLWQRYAANGTSGFCVEVDFSDLNNISPLIHGPSPVNYIQGPARVDIDLLSILRSHLKFESEIEKIWNRLFLEKNATLWHQQQEIRFLYYDQSLNNFSRGNGFSTSPGSLRRVYIKNNLDPIYKRLLLQEIELAIERGETNLELVEI